MPYISVDIDLDDVYQELRDREKQTLVDWLKEDGYLTKRDTEYEGQKSVINQLFDIDIDKLKQAYYSMSIEDIELIHQIAKRY